MIKQKRGSHIGVIVSFAIFVTFLVFLYLILEPTVTTQRDKQYVLEHLKLNLISNTSSSIVATAINISDVHPNKNCVRLKDAVKKINNADKLIIKDDLENTINYNISGQHLIVETGLSFSGFLKLYYSDELERSPYTDVGGCDPKEPDEYQIGFTKTYEKVFESKVGDLMESYASDYENLKIELGVPEGTEFSFSLLNSDREVIVETEMPEVSTSIYSEEFPIQYLAEEGNIRFGFLIIRVW